MAPWAARSAVTTATAATLPPPRTTRLTNGMHVRYVSKRDVPFLYQEVFQRRCYLQHGITLPPGGTALDCGGNIGLFALFAAEQLGPEGLVVSCEPLPPIYECLQHNVSAHQQWWQQQQQGQEGQQQEFAAQTAASTAAGGADPLAPLLQQQQQKQQELGRQAGCPPARIVALNVGVGDGSATAADFSFYPAAAGWSSMRPQGVGDVQADMGAFLGNALCSPQAAAEAGLDRTTAAAARWLRSTAPTWVYEAAWRGAVTRMHSGAQQYACPLLSVRQIVRDGEGELARRGIDLLKVDVERAELDVLRGVGDVWPLVRQVAMEVSAENLPACLAILRGEGGFEGVVVEQEGALAGSSLWAVYARR